MTQREDKTVHFATLVDLCLPKNVELDKKTQKYKGRVVTRDDVVQNDLDSYAVFTLDRDPPRHT